MAFLGAISEIVPVEFRPCALTGVGPRVAFAIASNPKTAAGGRIIEVLEVNLADAA
jgi:hypothetical protein